MQESFFIVPLYEITVLILIISFGGFSYFSMNVKY